MDNAKELNECLCCGSKKLRLTLDLGEQPMANSFKEAEDSDELKFPLQLNLCEDCSHLQLTHAVNPDLLFKNYLYVSGTSKTYLEYMDWFVKHTQSYFTKAPKAVLDIACNDGSQLNAFKAVGLKTYGIDPATNLYKLSSANHEVINDYFTQEHVETLKSKNLDIINAQNVFAHTDYPLEFLKMCKEIMHDDTMLFIQTSQADMVKNNEFDTIYHEHLSFFNANSMKALADRAGLNLIDITKTPIHGNSYMFVFSKTADPSTKVLQVLKEEADLGLQDLTTYVEYAKKCKQVVADLKETIKNYRGAGYVVCGYGAAAKGMTLLNFGNIALDFVIDDNPLKQGLFTPGMNIPVVGIEILKEVEDMNVVFIPLAWNLFKEIKSKIKSVRDKDSDIFVRYFPEIQIA
jgi:2-polyprenyl-3-methyl-5-hydroxy-6-metoxy-1,4-benzoquinol methylase/ribosomal protein L32